MSAIRGLSELPELRTPPTKVTPPAAPSEGVSSFADRLQELVQDVDQQQHHAEFIAGEYAAGRQNDLHGTMITMQKADISFRLLGSVRNRLIEAYREISRMGA